MSWDQYIEEREERRAWAHRTAEQLRAGDRSPDVFRHWGFASLPWAETLLDELLARPLAPSATDLAMHLGGIEVDEPPRKAPRRMHLAHASKCAAPPQGAHADLAWALAELDFVGRELEDYEREAWRATDYAPHDKRDQATARMWVDWFSGNPWDLRSRWEKAFLGAATRSFRAVCESRELPIDVRERAIADLREAFFFRLLGGRDSICAGWSELAVRVIETAGDGPVHGAALALTDANRLRLTRCASHRGGLADTTSALIDGMAEPEARGRALAKVIDEQPLHAEAYLDAHVARRVIGSLGESPRPRAWSLVTQNRGRARGRIRAVLAETHSDTLLKSLLSLDALFARTRAAVARYAWAWAWQELTMDFSFDASRPVTPPCLEDGQGFAPLSEVELAGLRTWVLLVILKGRYGHLRRWVGTASTGDRDSTWARLLTDSLPESLVDPIEEDRRARSYRRLRTELTEQLPQILDDLEPLLSSVAKLKKSRGLRGEFTDLVEPHWHPSVDFPKSGFPTFLQHASSALASLHTDPS